MNINWSPLKAELARWRAAQLPLPIWWRDDDAISDTTALRQLVALSDETGCPVHLAVIPKPATRGVVEACAEAAHLVPVVHGWRHQNHAPEGAKKAEFGHPRADALAETAEALTRMRNLFGTQLLEMFVPPWNRIDAQVVGGLAAQGYRMLSTFTPRRAERVAGLVQINTHLDPIFWRGGGGLADPDMLVAEMVKLLQDRRAGTTDASEPLGLLTHHLVHDPDIWAFCREVLSVLLEGGAKPANLLKKRSLS